MNILFIYSLQDARSSQKPLQNQGQMQFGISYISAFLKKHRHNTKLLVLNREAKKEKIAAVIREFKPRLICFSTVTIEFEFITQIAKDIKKNFPDIFLLIGGVHVSLNPSEKMLEVFDALCIGEGEYPTFELIEQLEKGFFPSKILNLWIKNKSEIEKNKTRPFYQNLDELPFPDRDIWMDWIQEPTTGYTILLGRGCPFICAYCSNHAIRRLSDGKYVRQRSSENIIGELKELTDKIPSIKNIYLEVETFGANKKWAIDLCEKLRDFNKNNKKEIFFGTNLRVTPNKDYDQLFAELKKSNFTFINIGLESGSERVRREVLKRNYSNEDIIKAVSSGRKHGLKIKFFNLIGIPGETYNDFMETVKMNRICLPDTNYLSIFFPYPGTSLHKLCIEQGLITNKLDTQMERRRSTLNLPDFSKKQIQTCFVWFEYYAFKGCKPIYKILSKVMVNKIHSNYYLNLCYRRLTSLTFFKILKKSLQS